jgi:hypothetical protein
MTDRPSTAVVLLIIGGAFYIAAGFAAGVLVESLGGFAARLGSKTASAEGLQIARTIMATGVMSGVAIIIGAALANTGNRTKVRIGAILAIIFSLIGLGNTLGGFIIGLVLVIAGSALALIWKPKEVSTQTAQTATPTSSL